MDTERITKELDAHKCENLHERSHFPEKHNLPKLTLEETDNLNRPAAIKEIKSIINNFAKQKQQTQMCSMKNSTKYLRKK